MKKRTTILILLLLIPLTVAAAAILPWRYAMRSDNDLTGNSKNPQETVIEFFDKICAGDFGNCEDMIINCDSLNFENTFENETDKFLYDKYLESLSYKIVGKPKIAGISATQKVEFSYMDIGANGESINSSIKTQIEERVVTARKNEDVYDENGEFIPEMTEKLYQDEITRLYEDSSGYMRCVQLNLKLYFKDGEWKIFADDELAKALMGEN